MSFSAATLRRSSTKYLINDMLKDDNHNYGVDMSFEISDKNNISYEFGNFGAYVDKSFNIGKNVDYPVVKYFWRAVTSLDNDDPINNTVRTDIMTLDADGMLSVNKIKLGDFELKVENGTGDDVNKQFLKWGDTIIASNVINT